MSIPFGGIRPHAHVCACVHTYIHIQVMGSTDHVAIFGNLVEIREIHQHLVSLLGADIATLPASEMSVLMAGRRLVGD